MRTFSRIIAVLISVLALIVGSAVVAPGVFAEDPAAIKGQVLAWMDPIDYAKVTVFNADTGAAIRTVTTDVSGNYMVTGLPAGRIQVRARKDGYLDSWADGSLTRDGAHVYTLQPGQTLEQAWSPQMVLYLDLTPEAAISGTVMGFNNSPRGGWDDPVSGVTVTAYDSSTGQVVGKAVTSPPPNWGEFRIGKLLSGSVKLRASGPGWLTTWAYDAWTKASAATFSVQAYGTTDAGTLAIYAPAGVQGSVMLDDEPIAKDITVTVVEAATGRTLSSIVDDDGYFRIEGLPPVPVKVRARGEFTTTGWANWATSPETATVFSLAPGVVLGESGSEGPYIGVVSTGSLQGQVLGEMDPLAEATVTVFDAATGQAIKSARTDGSGNYRIDKIPVGFAGRDLKVRASASGWVTGWANAKATKATADVFHLWPRQVLQQSWDPMVLYLDLARAT